MSRSPFDVAVIGAGVAGLSAARAAARAGLRVVVAERRVAERGAAERGAAERGAASRPSGTPPGGGGAAASSAASSLPAALANPWRGRKGDAHPHDLTGLATVRRWASELAAEGFDSGAVFGGALRIPSSARQARSWRARAAEAPSLAWLEPDAVGAPYHAPFGALRVEDGGRFVPSRWLAALAASARAAGADVRGGAPVARLVGAPGAPWRLSGHGGGEWATATAVVVATGADTAPVATFSGSAVAWPSWRATRGEVVTLHGGPAFDLPVAGGIYGASSGEVAWVGGGHRAPDAVDTAAPENLRAALAWSVPGLASARIASVWSGVRVKREDARPEVREVAPGLWTFGAFAGRGFLCAAFEAERWLADSGVRPTRRSAG